MRLNGGKARRVEQRFSAALRAIVKAALAAEVLLFFIAGAQTSKEK
jgi:hypothetical protein